MSGPLLTSPVCTADDHNMTSGVAEDCKASGMCDTDKVGMPEACTTENSPCSASTTCYGNDDVSDKGEEYDNSDSHADIDDCDEGDDDDDEYGTSEDWYDTSDYEAMDELYQVKDVEDCGCQTITIADLPESWLHSLFVSHLDINKDLLKLLSLGSSTAMLLCKHTKLQRIRCTLDKPRLPREVNSLGEVVKKVKAAEGNLHVALTGTPVEPLPTAIVKAVKSLRCNFMNVDPYTCADLRVAEMVQLQTLEFAVPRLRSNVSSVWDNWYVPEADSTSQTYQLSIKGTSDETHNVSLMKMFGSRAHQITIEDTETTDQLKEFISSRNLPALTTWAWLGCDCVFEHLPLFMDQLPNMTRFECGRLLMCPDHLQFPQPLPELVIHRGVEVGAFATLLGSLTVGKVVIKGQVSRHHNTPAAMEEILAEKLQECVVSLESETGAACAKSSYIHLLDLTEEKLISLLTNSIPDSYTSLMIDEGMLDVALSGALHLPPHITQLLIDRNGTWFDSEDSLYGGDWNAHDWDTNISRIVELQHALSVSCPGLQVLSLYHVELKIESWKRVLQGLAGRLRAMPQVSFTRTAFQDTCQLTQDGLMISAVTQEDIAAVDALAATAQVTLTA